MGRPKPDAAILIGIPGAGKTTFYVQNLLHTHLRVSLDMLRTRERESALLRACFELKQPFALDDTNVTAADRAPFLESARANGFRVSAYFFRPNVRRSIALNNKRTSKVPVYGILRAFKRLEPPTCEEGFDALYEVDLTADGAFEITNAPCD